MTVTTDPMTITELNASRGGPEVTPELAKIALVFLDRAMAQGRGEARELLRVAAVLEAIAVRGDQ